MFETIKENIAKASSYIGDFIENPRATTARLFHDATLGSIPERKVCDCDDMRCELKHLQNLEMRGSDEA